jgi:hypothetical protein
VGSSGGAARPSWLWHFCVFVTPAVLLPVLPVAVRPVAVLICGVAVVTALLTGIRLFRPVNALGWYALAAAVTTVLLVGLIAPMLDEAGLLKRSPLLDAVYYLSYPVYGLALTVLPTRGRPGSQFAGLTEAGIVTTGAVVVWWAFIIDPVVMDSRPRGLSFPPDVGWWAVPPVPGCVAVSGRVPFGYPAAKGCREALASFP